MSRILLAESAISKHFLATSLADHEILEASTFTEAARLIVEDHIRLFVICILFDDSRAMELVNLIRNDSKHRETPILVTRVAPSKMAASIRETMTSMKSLSIINDYLEIEGDAMACRKLQETVSELLCEKRSVVSETARK